jgi:hypothetical protein
VKKDILDRKGRLKQRLQFQNGFELFLPGVLDARDKKAVQEAMQDDPQWRVLFLALTRGGRVQMNPTGVKKGKRFTWQIDAPVRSVDWTELHVQVAAKDGLEGLLIKLPSDLACLHAAWLACLAQRPYDWKQFTIQYRNMTNETLGEMMVRLVNSRMDGIQMPADSDPRLAPKQVDGKTRYYVGLTPKTMKRFVKEYGAERPELVRYYEEHGTLAGAMLLLVRFPTVYKKSGLWCEVVELADRVDGKIYHDAWVWKCLQDGDDDGDLAYLGFDQHGVNFVKERSRDPEAYPPLVVGRSQLMLAELVGLRGPPTTIDDDVLAIRNSRLKCLTGTITYVMKCVAYSYAHLAAADKETPHQRMLAKAKAFAEAYDVAAVLISAALDMKKVEGAVDGVAKFAQACQVSIQGGPLDIEPFLPILKDHPALYQQLTRLVNATAITENGHVERSLKSCRRSLYGQYVVSQNHLRRSGHHICERGLGAGIREFDLWDAFTLDALGERIVNLEIPRPPKAKPPKEPIVIVGGKLMGQEEWERMLSLFKSLTWKGQPVFEGLGVHEEDDCLQVTGGFRPRWKGKVQFAISLKRGLRLPRIAYLEGSDHGHMLVQLGKVKRLFMPIFRPGPDGPVTIDIWTYLREALIARMERMDGYEQFDQMPTMLQEAITDAVTQLVEATPKELLVRRYEAVVQIKPLNLERGLDGQPITERDFVIEEEKRAQLLGQLAAMGWDIMTTSKNEPGKIVTRANKRGLPGYLAAVNPFECFDMKKRRNEKRELRMALTLAYPEPLPVTLKGQKALPPEFAQSITNLRGAIGDLIGLNYWLSDGGWGYDTLICCPSAVRKLALMGMTLTVKSEAERDRVLLELAEDDLVAHARWATTHTENGFEIGGWVIDVEGVVEDAGKIKACVGPLKGIMTVIPVQLRDAKGNDIDFVIPFETLKKKKGVSVWLYFLYQALGLTQVDPNLTLEQQVELVTEQLGGRDPREPVWASHLDDTGRDYQLAHADGTPALMLTGDLPVYRPVQTVRQTVRWKKGNRGIRMQPHAVLLARDEAGNALTWKFDAKARRAFRSVLKVRREMVQQVKDLLAGGEPVAAAPAPPVLSGATTVRSSSTSNTPMSEAAEIAALLESMSE